MSLENFQDAMKELGLTVLTLQNPNATLPDHLQNVAARKTVHRAIQATEFALNDLAMHHRGEMESLEKEIQALRREVAAVSGENQALLEGVRQALQLLKDRENEKGPANGC